MIFVAMILHGLSYHVVDAGVNVMQISVDSVSAGAACADGLDVYRHDVGARKLAADGRHFCQCVLHQVLSIC